MEVYTCYWAAPYEHTHVPWSLAHLSYDRLLPEGGPLKAFSIIQLQTS